MIGSHWILAVERRTASAAIVRQPAPAASFPSRSARSSAQRALTLLAGVTLGSLCACGGDSTVVSTLSPCEAAGPARARVLSEEDDFVEHESRGARPGDVVIENDTARFFVTAQPDADGYVPFAGWIIDAVVKTAEPAREYDGVDGYYPLVNLTPIAASGVQIVDDGAVSGRARVRVEGPSEAVPVVLGLVGTEPAPAAADVRVEYSLGACDRALEITTRIENGNVAAETVQVDDVVVFGDDEAEPFTLPAGFAYDSSLNELFAIGSSHEWLPASYALFPREGALSLFAGSTVADQIGSSESSMMGYGLGAHVVGPGEAIEVVRYLGVGRDVSEALADRWLRLGVGVERVSGRVLSAGAPAAGARISFFEDTELASFVGQALSGADGRFEAELPRGGYYALVTGRGNGEHVVVPGLERELGEGRSPADPTPIEAAAGAPELLMELGEAAQLRLRVRDGTGALAPAKVTFQGLDERRARWRRAGERVPYPTLGVRQIVWTPNGEADLAIEPGRYTVTASRGYTAALDVRREVELTAGETTMLELSVADVVDLGDYVAMDSHVHGVFSQHGEATRAERVITAAAEGLHVHVATDHDWVADYGLGVSEAGLEGRLLSIPGVELTTPFGHHCLWLLTPDPSAPRGGAVQWWWGGSLGEWYSHYRERGALVAQVAHGASYFRGAGYDPATGEVTAPQRFTWDFDAMELHNAKGNGGRGALVPIWFSLLNWGRRVAPVAASDSHTRVPEVGSARTYVRAREAFARGDAAGVAEAVRAGRTVASTGPFIDLRVRGATEGSPMEGGPGDTVAAAADGSLQLAIAVRAPEWIVLEAVELIREGETIARWDGASDPPVRFDASSASWFQHELSDDPGADAWYVIQASGSADLAPAYPGVRPWAMTAPVFVDRDGDGTVSPLCMRQGCSSSEPAP